jgi:hypothetical protein
MAVTLTDHGLYKLTNDANQGDVTEITFPTGTHGCVLYSDGADTYYTDAGTDGAAVGNDYFVVPSGNAKVVRLDRSIYGSPPVIYIASSAVSGVTRIEPLVSIDR